MTISTANLSAGEIAAFNNDRPLFACSNALDSYNVVPVWKANTDASGARANFPNWTAGSDITDNGYPTRFAFDRQLTSWTQPVYTAANRNYALLFDLGGIFDIDIFALINHQLRNYSTNAVTITYSFSDSNDFSTGAAYDVQLTAGGSNKRIVDYRMSQGVYTRISGCEFFRLNFHVPASAGTVPRVGELLLGRRHQMSYYQNPPFDDASVRSDVADFVPKSGARRRYVRYAGQRIYSPTWQFGHADANGLDQLTELRAAFAECNYGGKPFLYVNNPTTAPTVAPWMMFEQPDLDIPVVEGPTDRVVQTHLTEIAPFQIVEI